MDKTESYKAIRSIFGARHDKVIPSQATPRSGSGEWPVHSSRFQISAGVYGCRWWYPAGIFIRIWNVRHKPLSTFICCRIYKYSSKDGDCGLSWYQYLRAQFSNFDVKYRPVGVVLVGWFVTITRRGNFCLPPRVVIGLIEAAFDVVCGATSLVL